MKPILLFICTVALLASCSQPATNASNATNAKIEQNKATMQRFYDDVFNKHNVAAMDSILASNFVDHNPAPGYTADVEGTKKSLADFFIGFPDLNVKVNFMVADSNMVTAQFTIVGTNTGSMVGMAPTNKKMDIDGVDIMKFKDGKAVEHWGYMEEGKVMTQLGITPDIMNGKVDSTKTATK